jgi:hypothetical protein
LLVIGQWRLYDKNSSYEGRAPFCGLWRRRSDEFLNNSVLPYYEEPLPISDENTYRDILVDLQRRVAALAGLYTFLQLQKEGSKDEVLVKAAPLILFLQVKHQSRQKKCR